MLTMRHYSITALVGLTAFSLSANTLTGTATLTADNHYGLYTGLSDASDLSLIGRNEKGYSGNPGTYNWSNPESWSVSLEAGQHLYVLAWDDGGPQSWIGQFNFGSTTLYSNAAQWEYLIAPGRNPGESGDLPDLSSVIAAIQNGAWSQVVFETPNGSSPWGNIPGIDGGANFIAADGFETSVPSDAHFVIYRNREALAPIAAAPVPEAGTSAAGLALAVLAGIAAHRRRKAAVQ